MSDIPFEKYKGKKCAICGKEFRKEDTVVPYKKRYVHEECFNSIMRELGTSSKRPKTTNTRGKKETSSPIKEPSAIKAYVTEEEHIVKQQFFDYLRPLVGNNLNAKIYTLVQNYMKKFSFTWQGMYFSLKYQKEVLNKQLTGDVVGSIPYVYDEAQEYYNQLKEAESINKEIAKNYKLKEVKVRYKPTKPYYDGLIDISKLGIEGGGEH